MDNHQLKNIIKEIQQKEGVGLAEIAVQTGLDRSYLSSFIHAKVKKSVTEKMLGKLTKGFPAYFNGKQQHPTPELGHRNTLLTGAHVTLQDYINEIKTQRDMFYALLSSNLGSLQEGQRTLIAYQKAWVDQFAEKESKGDPNKKAEIMYRVNKLVDDILSASSLSGTQTGSGKRSRE